MSKRCTRHAVDHDGLGHERANAHVLNHVSLVPILVVDHEPIQQILEMLGNRNRVGLIPVGEEIELDILREGRPMRVRARVGELYKATTVTGKTIPQLAGARVTNVEPGMPMYGHVEGVVVTRVEQGSAAFRNGLRAGDIVFGVNRVRVRSVQDLLDAMRSAEAPTRLAVLRGDYRITLVVR